MVDKTKLTERDFQDLLDKELIAYHSYRLIIKEKLDDEYVDIIANTYCGLHGKLKDSIPLLYEAKIVLANDYKTNIYALPFRYEDIKLEVKRYDLIKQLELYFELSNTPFKKGKAFVKGQELSSSNSFVGDIMEQIHDIDIDLINIDNSKTIGL